MTNIGIKRHGVKLLWLTNLILGALLVYTVMKCASREDHINWYILDTLPHHSQLLFDAWAEGSPQEMLIAGVGPASIHYFWCGQRQFHYRNYLSVLSAFKVIKPDRIRFHYTHLPLADSRTNVSWFDELQYSIAILSLEPLLQEDDCASDVDAYLVLAINTLATEGGIYVGESTILTRFTPLLRNNSFVNGLFYDPATTQSPEKEGVLVSKGHTGFLVTKADYRSLLSNGWSRLKCGSIAEYNKQADQYACIVIDWQILPTDTLHLVGPFGETSRWLAFGKTDIIQPVRSNDTLAPLISHVVWRGEGKMSLLDYLSVTSTLYVAGLQVKFYAHQEPSDKYWAKVKQTGNVTFVKLNHHYGNKVEKGKKGDIVCVDLILKYGGFCQDTHVLWTNRVTEFLRGYNFVIGYDGSFDRKSDRFDVSVLMGKRHAKFLRVVLPSLRLYEESNWNEESVGIVHHLYERFPDLVYTNHFLTVGCDAKKCYPTWPDAHSIDQPNAKSSPKDELEPGSAQLSVNISPDAVSFFEDEETLKNLHGPLADIVDNIHTASGSRQTGRS